MKTLIVGGHGFLGTTIANQLQKTNYEVICRSRRDGFDLLELNNTIEILSEMKPEIIFNCAAHVGSVHYVSKYAGDVFHDNVQMNLNLYKAIKKSCNKAIIINPLSNCSYPGDANIHLEKDWWYGEVHDSVFSYGNGKRFIYVLSKSFYQQFGIKTLNFLVPNAFGPGDYLDPDKTHALNGMIIRMLKAKINGDDKFVIWGTGNPKREWGYIKDIAKIMIEGSKMEKDLLEPINMAQNKGYSIKESAQIISEEIKYEGELVFDISYQDGAPTKILDDKLFRNNFPNFVFTDHRFGIQETVSYYNGKIKGF